VDGAIQQAQGDRAAIIDKHIATKADLLRSLGELMADLDFDGSGGLTKEEWEGIFEDEKVHAILVGLGVQTENLAILWEMLDVNNDGQLDAKEFIEGIMRLKGPASSIDMHYLMGGVSRIMRESETLNRQLKQLSSELHIDPSSRKCKLLGTSTIK